MDYELIKYLSLLMEIHFSGTYFFHTFRHILYLYLILTLSVGTIKFDRKLQKIRGKNTITKTFNYRGYGGSSNAL